METFKIIRNKELNPDVAAQVHDVSSTLNSLTFVTYLRSYNRCNKNIRVLKTVIVGSSTFL